MTNQEVRELLDSADARQLRRRAGIPAACIARALGVTTMQVCLWEQRKTTPRGPVATSYGRIVSGLRNHAEVRREAYW